MQHYFLGVGLHRIIDADQIRSAFESLTHLLGHGDLPSIVWAIDFGHDRRHNRRAGRHFNHFGIAAGFPPNGRNGRADRRCNFVA